MRLKRKDNASQSTNPCPIAVHMEPFSTSAFKVSCEYLLLPPRSAPDAASLKFTPKAALQPLRPPTHWKYLCQVGHSVALSGLVNVCLAFQNSSHWSLERPLLQTYGGPNFFTFSSSTFLGSAVQMLHKFNPLFLFQISFAQFQIHPRTLLSNTLSLLCTQFHRRETFKPVNEN